MWLAILCRQVVLLPSHKPIYHPTSSRLLVVGPWTLSRFIFVNILSFLLPFYLAGVNSIYCFTTVNHRLAGPGKMVKLHLLFIDRPEVCIYMDGLFTYRLGQMGVF
jgi:hypothetical protein